ncbi:MAG: DNA polymerase I, partial [Firmicutes bacterium]|nr:DNA polymerase I [Bacillota bacterium]
RLATIMLQVPLDVEIEQCIVEEPDYDKLIEIYTKLEFNRFLSKLRVKGGESEAAKPDKSLENPDITVAAGTVKAEDFRSITVDSDEKLKDIKLDGETILKVFGDNNHVARPVIDGVTMACHGKCYYFPVDKLSTFGEWLAAQETRYTGHDLIDDYYMLMCNYDVSVMETAFDTAITQYVLDSARSNYNLAALSNEYLHETIEDEKEFMAANAQIDMFSDGSAAFADYGLKYCVAVSNLRILQEARIKAEKLEKLLYEVELPLVEVMASMEKEGFRTDRDFLENFGKELGAEIDRLADSIHEMAGEDFNINSPQQLGVILFEKLELKHGKKTKKGYSTSADILEKIKGDHPIIPAILEYRTLAKLKSTYVDGLIPLINTDGKIHAHFQQTVAATGRLSCTEPNLQNIPIRQELGRQLRKAFVPETDDCILTGADYSQIELRVLAHMAEDPALIKAFNDGEDIHRATAANVLGISEDEITPMERSRAKAVNFGVVYGMSAFGLSDNLDITRKEAEEYIAAYFQKHEKVREFMDEAVDFAKSEGYALTLMGRKRYIKEIHASNYNVRMIGERLAMNTP